MIDSVRNALSSAIRSSAPPVPEFGDTPSRLAYLRWLGEMSERLKKKVPDAPSRIVTRELVYTALTRARDRFVLAGSPSVFRAALDRRVRRASSLASYLGE